MKIKTIVMCLALSVMSAGCEEPLRFNIHTGVNPDYCKLKLKFIANCNKGIGSACNKLGALYYEGWGAKINIEKAKQLFGKACDLNYAFGCSNYNKLERDGGKDENKK